MSRTIVELTGPAGAGKTTIVNALRAEDPWTCVGADVGRLRTAGSLGRATPRLFAERVTARGRWWTAAELRSIAYLGAWRGPLSRDSGDRPGDWLMLLDHGPVFRLAMLAAHGPAMTRTPTFRQWWRHTARDWAGLLDAVVCLDAPDEVLRNRIDGRDRDHRVRHAGRSEAEAFLARYREAFAAALELMAAAGTPVFHVDTSPTPDEVTHVVRSRIGGITSQALR